MKVRFAVGPHSGSLSSGDLLAFADALEAGGFDGIWLSGANVVPLGRNPFLLAKQLAQLDQITGGRLLLSFVTGLNQPGEREALGLAGASRGVEIEEVLGLLRSWWAGEPVDHHSDRWVYTGLVPAARPVQDPLEVWFGGRGPKTLDRVGRVADGWLGAQLTPAEAKVARERIQVSADRASREVDPEHFEMSIAYARTLPDPEVLGALTARRADTEPLALVPVGEQGLRSFINAYIEAGLSKFVVRPFASVASWADEAEWLGNAILDLQT